MKAMVIREPGGPDVLEMRDVSDPSIGPEDVLVRVRAIGVNRADLLQRAGVYPAPHGVSSDIPGLEFAGEVESVGARVLAWKKGDRVMGLVGGGAYAELVVAHEGTLHVVDDSHEWESAAAIPESIATAYDALVLQGGLEYGDTALITAGASGVGCAGIQIAKAMGAKVIATTRTEKKRAAMDAFGADSVIVGSTAKDLTAALPACSVDVVMDLVGGAYVGASTELLRPKGTLVLVGLLAGRSADLDLGLILRKRLKLVGTVLRSRSLEEKLAVTRELNAHVLPMVRDGRVKPVVDRVFPFAEAAAAHMHLATNESIGKVVLTLS